MADWNPTTQFVNGNKYKSSDFVKGNHFLFMLPVKKRSNNNSYYIVDDFTEADELMPIGMVQDLTLSQQKTLQRFFEIGSDVSAFAENRVMGDFGVSKLLLSTGNILKYFDFVKGTQNGYQVYNDSKIPNRKIVFSILRTIFAREVSLVIALYKEEGTLFNTPDDSQDTTAELIKNAPNKIIALHDTLLDGYSLSISANNPMVAENLHFSFVRLEAIGA